MSAGYGVPLRWLVHCLLGVIVLGAGDRMWNRYAEYAGATVTASIQLPAP